ncbi:MAG: efflux RND transporter periplasmic adaptor subunit [Verrucomicrobiota bacterium]|nr:efflux RND transporter periplasmic adaptor subunit [Verrucomicrobiota bacterium]
MSLRPSFPLTHAALCACLLVFAGCDKKPAAPERPTPTVSVIKVVPKSIPITESFIGQADATKNIEILPRVSGIITKRFYIEGTFVKKGDKLYLIDPAPFEAAVRDSQAKVEQAAARYELAKKTYARYEPLVATKAVAAKDLDDVTAQVESTKADLEASVAALDNAKINLGYSLIVAPLDGRIGKTMVNEGSNVTAQNTKLTDLQILDPIYIYYRVPESALLQYRKLTESGKLTDMPFDQFTIKANFTDGTEYPETGKIDFTATQLDTQTDSYPLRAIFPNPSFLIIPGQYLQVTMVGATRNDSIVIPQKAVLQEPQGAFVYIVNSESKIEARTLKLLRYVGNDWLIEGGLDGGETLVVDGIQKVRPGAIVKTVPYQAPTETKK